jgi:hypothetical protein
MLIRNIKLFLYISFALIVSSCDNTPVGYPNYPAQTGVCDYFDKTHEMLTFWLGVHPELGPDVKLQMPREYVGSPLGVNRFRTDKLDGAALFSLRLSDFAPYSNKQKSVIKTKPKAWSGILFQSKSDLNANLVISMGLTLSRDPKIGLIDVRDSGQEFDFDLIQFGHRYHDKNLFLGVKDNRPTDIIDCFKPDTVPYPNCSHLFIYKNVSVKLNYSLPDLKHWKLYRKRAEEFASCAYVEST